MPLSLAVPRSNKAKLRPSETVRELTLAEEAFATLFAEPSKMKKIEEVPIIIIVTDLDSNNSIQKAAQMAPKVLGEFRKDENLDDMHTAPTAPVASK